MALKKAWRAMAWLTAIAALPACATSGNEATGTSGSSSSTSSSTGEGGQGGGGEGGQGGAAPCGDGTAVMPEACDDGNTVDGDGCSATCAVEQGWACAGVHSKCAATCSDGQKVGPEECDDQNLKKNDGCNDRCEIEYGWSCSGSPSECTTNCGDGFLNGKEQCDDGNNADGDGCSRACQVEKGYSCIGAPSKCIAQCGDGIRAPKEECDDRDVMPGDGCSDTCKVEDHWTCTGEPSDCVTPCGDGFKRGIEACDDGNMADDDGCSKACTQDPGYICTGEPSTCATSCGDGIRAGTEVCDDKNTANDDGCNVNCKVEIGWTCTTTQPSVCTSTCGDGFPTGPEKCDDGNTVDNDGCAKDCTVEKGYVCSNIPSQCVTVCGDSVRGGHEACDDGNANDGDGCSSACVLEPGWTCTNAPNMPTTCVSVCGDGILVRDEICDDHNLVNGDCCSAACLAEPGCEIELNDAIGSANDFGMLSLSGAIKGHIQPAGESDYYKITIPPNIIAALTVATVDGPTSSCLNNSQDSTVTLYDSSGISLGTDDNSGVGKHCARLVVGGLSGGSDYYVEVKASKPNLTFDYGLQLSIQVTVCGDYVLQPGEECDDGNTTSGDGCSQSCVHEPVTEVEPNDSAVQANMVGPFNLNAIISGAITPVGDVDFFRFNVAKTVDLRVETFNSVGTNACSGVDTKLDLVGANGTSILASNDDKASGTVCSLINPADATNFPGARHLSPGTYYARVQHYSNSTAITGYTLVVTPVAICGNGVKDGSEPCDGTSNCDANCDLLPVCGDGLVIGLETCDDGNTTNGDGCSSTCQIESVCGDGVVAGTEICDDHNTANGDGCSSTCQIEGALNESEPNNNFLQADAKPVISASTVLAGSIGVTGDKDFFKLSVAAPSVVRFENFEGLTTDCPTIATTIRLFDSAKAQLKLDTPASESSIASGIKACAALVAALDAGTYYVQVEKTGNNAAIPIYSFDVKFETPAGNEVEPNDALAQATSVAGSDVWVFGNHQVVADSDYYALTVPAGKSIRAEVIEGDATETCESKGIDSYLNLFNAAATLLAMDDDDGRGYCSAIDGTGAVPRDAGARALAAGTYYLQVKATGSGASGQFNYKLAVTIR
jgi:cysteine-rich repeat protein